MREKQKLLIKFIITLALTLSLSLSCTTVQVPSVDPLRMKEVQLPPKLQPSAGDDKQISISLYELKNAVFYREFAQELVLRFNKDAAVMNENNLRIETALLNLKPQINQIQNQRNFAYGLAGGAFLATVLLAIGTRYGR